MGGLGLVTAFSAWLLWDWTGVLVMLVAIGALYAFAPRLPPEIVMRMYRARPLDPRHGEQIAYIVDELSRRAELPAAPARLRHPQHDAQRLCHRHAATRP